MNARNKKLIGLFAFVLLVSLLLACGRPRPTPTPEPTATFTPTSTPKPTNTPVPTNTPKPTNTPAPTKAPPATPTKAPQATPTKQGTQPQGLVILSHTGFFDEDGNAVVVGEVLNNDQGNYQYIEIQVDLKDKNGKTIQQEKTYAFVDILEPGQKAPFKLTVWDPPADLDKYEIAASGNKTTDKPIKGLEFVQHFDQTDEYGNLSIIGEIKYTGDKIAAYPHVAVTFYDADGNVVDASFTSAERDFMVKDKISPFKIYMGRVHGEPKRYELAISASEATDMQLQDVAKIELTDIGYYIDSLGDLIIVGEAKNADTSNAEFIKVFTSIYDKNDKLVAVEWSYVWADILLPGGLSPFKIGIWNTPKEADHWTVWVQGSKTNDKPAGNLVFAKTDNKLANGVATFSGTIRNDGKETMESIEVAVTIYDKEGNVVMTDWEWLEGEIAPGGTMDFEFEVEVPESASDYELYVQGVVKQ